MGKVVPIREATLPAIMQDSIDRETLAAFMDMRRLDMRKPMSQRAVDMLLRKLARLEAEGHDPNLLLERSIIGGWQDVYPSESTMRQNPVGFVALHTDRSWADDTTR